MINLLSNSNFLSFIRLILLAILVYILIGCGGGFRQDSQNANEFLNPIFNVNEFKSDTIPDTTFTY